MTLSNPAQYISGRTVQEQMNSLIDYVDQRAAEVATDAIAADVAQVHQDMLDADADATAAAASAAAAAGTLANAVKKTGEASQSIAGDIAVTGSLDAASIGSGSTPVVCGNLTAYGSVSLDDTTLQGNLSGADSSALINLSGVGSVLVPAPTSNGEAATKKYVDDADALKLNITDINTYAVGLTGNQTATGTKTFNMASSGACIIVVGAGGGNQNEGAFIIRDNRASKSVGDGTDFSLAHFLFQDNAGNFGGGIYVEHMANNTTKISVRARNSDGSYKRIYLAEGDVI